MNSIFTPQPEENEDEAVRRLGVEDTTSEDTQRRLSIVDHLLLSAPLVSPAAEFAERVLAAIRQQQQQAFNGKSALGLALGVGVAIAVVVSMMATLLLLVANLIVNWTLVYQNLVLAAGQSADFFSILPDPALTILAVASVPLFFVWVWIMRHLRPQEHNA